MKLVSMPEVGKYYLVYYNTSAVKHVLIFRQESKYEVLYDSNNRTVHRVFLSESSWKRPVDYLNYEPFYTTLNLYPRSGIITNIFELNCNEINSHIIMESL